MSEWYEHERIEEVDHFAKKHLTKIEFQEYLGTFTGEYEDWSTAISRWIEDKISVLQTIQELVDDLPDELEEEMEG